MRTPSQLLLTKVLTFLPIKTTPKLHINVKYIAQKDIASILILKLPIEIFHKTLNIAMPFDNIR